MKIIFTIITLLTIHNCFGQNAYYDALTIAEIDTLELQKILRFGEYHFVSVNELVTEKRIILLENDEKKDLDNAKFENIDDDFCLTYNESQTNVDTLSLLKITRNPELREKYSIVDTWTGNDARPVKGYDLTRKETEQINNLILFIRSPFSQDVKAINLDIINDAIDKFNTYSSRVSTSEIKKLGFAQTALIGSGATTLIQRALSGDFSLSEDDQTKIIDGLTKYIAEEFKRAQLETYMNVFERTIGKIGEFQVLFPKTYAKLKSTDPTKFTDLGDELKEIFSQDLKALLDNFVKHVDNHKCTSSLESKLTLLNSTRVKKIKKLEGYESLKIAMDASSKLINNYHPVDLFHYLDEKYYKERTTPVIQLSLDKQIGFYLHGLNLFQQNFLDTAKTKDNRFSNVWLNYQQLQKINTPEEKKFFTALIYQQDRTYFNQLFSVTISGATGMSDAEVTALMGKMKKQYQKIMPMLIELQDFRANLDKENLEGNFEDYVRMVLRVIESMTDDPNNLDDFFTISDNVIDIYENVRDKDFSNTVFHFTEIMVVVIDKLEDSEELMNVLAKIDQYGSFMAAVVNAENSDEIKEVIKQFVAPPASYVFKRQHLWTLSVSAHPGYFLSLEGRDQFAQPQFVSGLTLPIGFDLTYKLGRSERDESASLGLSAQLLDLGAILNFRVEDSTATLPDKVNFKQFFSPGFSVNYGFKNSPLTIGFGYQYTPELRKITTSTGNEIYPQYHRLSLRLSWDLPLLFIAKSKRFSTHDFR